MKRKLMILTLSLSAIMSMAISGNAAAGLRGASEPSAYPASAQIKIRIGKKQHHHHYRKTSAHRKNVKWHYVRRNGRLVRVRD